MFFFEKRNLRGLLENRLRAQRTECQKQRISSSGLAQPKSEEVSQPLSAARQLRNRWGRAGSVTLPLAGERGQAPKEGMLSPMCSFENNIFFKDRRHCTNITRCDSGSPGGGVQQARSGRRACAAVVSCHTAILPEDVLSSPPRSCIFFNPQ